MPKTQRLSDAALVRRSQQGDRRAFGALVSRYDRRLRGLAYALLLDREQMDAALGLAYMRSWRDVLRIKPRDDIGPWLYRAVYNACIDQLRRNETPGGNRPAPVEVPPGAPGGLWPVLGTLAPADRVAVVLVEREGFSATSAARILGVTPDELETRLDIVRDRLAPYVPEPAAAGAVSGNGAEGQAGQPDEGRARRRRARRRRARRRPGRRGRSGRGGSRERGHTECRRPEPRPRSSPPPTAPPTPRLRPIRRPPRRRTRRRRPPRPQPRRTVTPPTAGAGGAPGAGPTAPSVRRPGPPQRPRPPAGEPDDTEPANGDAASDDRRPSAGDDGSAHPAAAAPSTGEHRAADR